MTIFSVFLPSFLLVFSFSFILFLNLKNCLFHRPHFTTSCCAVFVTGLKPVLFLFLPQVQGRRWHLNVPFPVRRRTKVRRVDPVEVGVDFEITRVEGFGRGCRAKLDVWRHQVSFVYYGELNEFALLRIRELKKKKVEMVTLTWFLMGHWIWKSFRYYNNNLNTGQRRSP